MFLINISVKLKFYDQMAAGWFLTASETMMPWCWRHRLCLPLPWQLALLRVSGQRWGQGRSHGHVWAGGRWRFSWWPSLSPVAGDAGLQARQGGVLQRCHWGDLQPRPLDKHAGFLPCSHTSSFPFYSSSTLQEGTFLFWFLLLETGIHACLPYLEIFEKKRIIFLSNPIPFLVCFCHLTLWALCLSSNLPVKLGNSEENVDDGDLAPCDCPLFLLLVCG